MKYLALTLSTFALALLTLVAVVMSQTIGTTRHSAPPVQTSLRPLDERQLHDQAELGVALSELMPLAQRLRAGAVSPSTTSAPGSNVSFSATARSIPAGQIFALTPEMPQIALRVERRPAAARIAVAPQPLPRVNVVLEGGSVAKAMVNGRLVSVGDHIEGGMVVKSIDIGAVTFASGNEELEIEMPLKRLRVLGAFPPTQKVD